MTVTFGLFYVKGEDRPKVRLFGNKTLWQIFGPKRDDCGEWRKLYNEELHKCTIHLICSVEDKGAHGEEVVSEF